MYQTSLKNRVAQCAAWISIGGTEGHVLQGMVTWVQSIVRTVSFELHAAADGGAARHKIRTYTYIF